MNSDVQQKVSVAGQTPAKVLDGKTFAHESETTCDVVKAFSHQGG